MALLIEIQSSIKRQSWDTCVKHYYRLGLEKHIPEYLTNNIPSSNISRWKQEPESKYKGSELSEYINQEIDLIKRFNQSAKIKTVIECYFKLSDVLNHITSKAKGVKSLIKNNMELVVNTVESVKQTIPINKALKLFNISRSSFENYKTILIHKCEASYYKWCSRKMPNQLLANEVHTIKNYMNHDTYRYWSKSSIYLKAIRDNALTCGLFTFYKYCNLLGFTGNNIIVKPHNYNPLKTTKPNQVWCADVTIFKTHDGVKHYIHILMDLFSKMILGYQIEKHSSGKVIRHLLQSAYLKYKPKQTLFLTDGGSENVNVNVSSLIDASCGNLQHKIAQRDVLFSNSMIEAFNKVLKYQFLYPKTINSRTKLEQILHNAIETYNLKRPQLNLNGNTPIEVFNDSPIDFSTYSDTFKAQKQYRIAQNRNPSCKLCL